MKLLVLFHLPNMTKSQYTLHSLFQLLGGKNKWGVQKMFMTRKEWMTILIIRIMKKIKKIKKD